MASASESLDDEKAAWVNLVGKFVLGFGDIELVTFILWREYKNETPPPHNFKERAGTIVGELRKDPSKPKQVADLLVQALRLADVRNTIAHHPLQVQFFRHIHTGEIQLEPAITSEISDEYITRARLETLMTEVESIRQSLYRALWPAK